MKLKPKQSGIFATIGICVRQIFDGSFLFVAGEYMVHFLKFFILILMWKSLAKGGVDLNGMTLSQLLTYTLMASVLRQQLEIVTGATASLWEGSIVGRYLRPMPIFTSFITETIGRWWIPVWLFYSLPMLLISPLFGINPLPSRAIDGLLALVSLVLSASLGFALDFLFASIAIRLKNACWAANQIREAISALLSGALIPFAMFSDAVGTVLSWLPFGSIANAPLSIYIGTNQAGFLIGLQLFWNIVIWWISVIIFKKSEERMISFGG